MKAVRVRHKSFDKPACLQLLYILITYKPTKLWPGVADTCPVCGVELEIAPSALRGAAMNLPIAETEQCICGGVP